METALDTLVRAVNDLKSYMDELPTVDEYGRLDEIEVNVTSIFKELFIVVGNATREVSHDLQSHRTKMNLGLVESKAKVGTIIDTTETIEKPAELKEEKSGRGSDSKAKTSNTRRHKPATTKKA